jgi:hypothetical protein
MVNNDYYVYVYLDPRKFGEYKYGEYTFSNEPIYVGKGKNGRYKDHLQENQLNNNDNIIKQRKLKKILKEGLTPIIIFVKNNLSEVEALTLEKDVILKIGKIINKNGPLTNLTDGGGGVSGRLITDEFKAEQSERMRNYYSTNPIPDTTRLKISQNLLSKNMRRSAEMKKKISKANKGRVYSDEYLLRMKEIRKGPKLSHRKKYILTNPNNEVFEILGKEELINFINDNDLSVRKIISSVNKGVITSENIKIAKTAKTKNCVGWDVKKIMKDL